MTIKCRQLLSGFETCANSASTHARVDAATAGQVFRSNRCDAGGGGSRMTMWTGSAKWPSERPWQGLTAALVRGGIEGGRKALAPTFD
eukprot:6186074-Pleurochrysis_carterae.AAC.4